MKQDLMHHSLQENMTKSNILMMLFKTFELISLIYSINAEMFLYTELLKHGSRPNLRKHLKTAITFT